MTAFFPRFTYSLPLSLLALLALGSRASAQIVNSSFESNTVGSTAVAGWTTIGSAVIADSSFGDSPTDGSHQLFLNNDRQASLSYNTSNAVTAASLESFFGLSSGALSGLSNGNATYGSGIQQTFTLTQSEALSFDYDFVTSEDPAYPPANPDFSFVSLSGSASSLAVLANVASASIPEPPQTGRTSPSIDDYASETGYQTFQYQTVLGPGTYTLGLGVVNSDTPDVGSGLLVDNVNLQPVAAVPEAGTGVSMALLLGLGGLTAFRRRMKLTGRTAATNLL